MFLALSKAFFVFVNTRCDPQQADWFLYGRDRRGGGCDSVVDKMLIKTSVLAYKKLILQSGLLHVHLETIKLLSIQPEICTEVILNLQQHWQAVGMLFRH